MLQNDLEQTRWAIDELGKCTVDLQDAYSKMEEHVAEHAPDFIVTLIESGIPPEQVKKLRGRCRQAARVLWYDWRAKLESASSQNLQAAQQSFEYDLKKFDSSSQQIKALEAAVAGAKPALPAAAAAGGADVAAARVAAEASLAARETALAEATRRAESIEAELRHAEESAAAVAAAQKAHVTEMASLTQKMALVRAQPAAAEVAAAGGADGGAAEDLISALQMGQCWEAVTLSTSSIKLRFKDTFEAEATLTPGAPPSAAVAKVDLRCVVGELEASPQAILLRTFFAQTKASLGAQLRSCRGVSQLGALLRAAALRLGRIIEIGQELKFVEARVPLTVAPLVAGGAELTLHCSFFEARAKFELKLTLTSEAPEAPLFWAVDAPSDLFSPAVDVERVVGAACERYTRGFGRLCDIYCAIDAQMRAPRA